MICSVRTSYTRRHHGRHLAILDTAATLQLSQFLTVTANMASRLLKLSMDIYFRDSADKDAFILRLRCIRERLTLPGEKLLSYHDLMLSIFDAVEREATRMATAAETTTMLRRNGKFSFRSVAIRKYTCKS